MARHQARGGGEAPTYSKFKFMKTFLPPWESQKYSDWVRKELCVFYWKYIFHILYWIGLERVGNLVPDFNGIALGFFPLTWCWLWAFCKQTLLCWGMPLVSLMSTGLLLWRSVGFSQRPFLNLMRWSCIFFVFQLIYMVDYIYQFTYAEPFLHLWDKTYLTMVGDFFYVFLDSVSKYFIWEFLDLC